MKIKENKIMTNTQRCDTIDSQEEYSDESPQNQIETEEGSAGGTPRPSYIESGM